MATIEHLNYRGYDTRTFAEIFPSDEDFADFYENCGAPQRLLTGTGDDGIDYDQYGIAAIYFLLVSNYANDHIASYDENRFKLQVMQIIYEAGPAWQKAMGVQEKLLNMGPNDILRGSKAQYKHNGTWGKNNTTSTNGRTTTNGKDILNHAQHPDTAPQSASAPYNELPYISDQQAHKNDSTVDVVNGITEAGTSTVNEGNTAEWTKDTVKGWVELLYSLDDTLCSRFIYRFKKLFQKVAFPNRPPLMFRTEADYD